jgi:ferritin-like metal-binding protein YciE
MSSSSLQNLLVSQLRDLYSAARQVLLIWPQLAQQVRSTSLREAIEGHRAETGMHLARLIEMLDALGRPATGVRSRGMEGLLVELLTQLAAEGGTTAGRDAAIVAGCQRVEAYELAVYGNALALARTLGLESIAVLLTRTMTEEDTARRRLELIAVSEVHPAALAESSLASRPAADAEAIPITSAPSLRGGLRA